MTENKGFCFSPRPLLLPEQGGIALHFLISTCVCQSASLWTPLLRCRTQGALCCAWPLLCKCTLSGLHSTPMWMYLLRQEPHSETIVSPGHYLSGETEAVVTSQEALICVSALFFSPFFGFAEDASVIKHTLYLYPSNVLVCFWRGCAEGIFSDQRTKVTGVSVT